MDDNLPSFDEIWEYNLPCKFVIPGSLINDWASIVEKILDDLTTLPPNDTVNAWKKLFMVAKCLWSRTSGGRRNEAKRKACILRKRIQMWNEDKIDILWSNFKSQVEQYRTKSRMKSRLLKKNANLKKGKSNDMNLGINDMKKINEQKIKEDIKKKSKKD